jgi:hypothetical protein
MSGTENVLSLAKDGLMVAAVLTGVANGIQGARFARQAKDGAVPIESGTEPALETPQQAAGIQRRLDVLGNVNVGVGVGADCGQRRPRASQLQRPDGPSRPSSQVQPRGRAPERRQ